MFDNCNSVTGLWPCSNRSPLDVMLC